MNCRLWFKKLTVSSLLILWVTPVYSESLSDCLGEFSKCQNFLTSLTDKTKSATLGKLTEECEKNSLSLACVSLGLWYDRQEDVASAEKFFRLGCAANSQKSCLEGGYLLERQGREQAADDMYSFACAKPGGAESCRALAQNYREKGDIKKAFKFYNLACNQKEAAACVDAADISSFSQVININKDAKFELLRKGCTFENGAACFRLGEMLVDRDYPEAAKDAYKKACLVGSEAGCVEFKNLNGGGLGKDYTQYFQIKKQEVKSFLERLFPVGPSQK